MAAGTHETSPALPKASTCRSKIPSSPQPFPGQKEVDGRGNSRQDTAVSIFLRKAYELRRHVLTRGNATVNIKKNFCAG